MAKTTPLGVALLNLSALIVFETAQIKPNKCMKIHFYTRKTLRTKCMDLITVVQEFLGFWRSLKFF